MAASRTVARGSMSVSSLRHLTGRTACKSPIMQAGNRNLQMFLAVNVMGKRYFFNTVKAAVSYYYDVLLHTGNRFGAGTDANVFLELYGEKGSSGEIPIPTRKEELERGMVNKYKVASKDLGTVQKIRVRHDNSGLGPAWYLEKVTVKDHSGSCYVFDCGQWLQKRSGEDRLEAQLTLSEQVLDQVSRYKGKSTEYLKLNEREHLSAVEESVHENLTSVLQGMLGSSSEDKLDFSQISGPGTIDQSNDISLKHASMLPAARLLVEAFGLKTQKIPATGPKGHLLKGDVLKYIEVNKVQKLPLQKATHSVPVSEARHNAVDSKKGQTPMAKKVFKGANGGSQKSKFEDLPLNDNAIVNASAYLNAKSNVPHLYSTAVCNMNSAMASCKEFSQDGTSISITAFVLKAVSAAIRLVPEMNTQHMGSNVASPSYDDITATLHTDNGPRTGIVQKVNQKNLQDIENSLQDIKTNDATRLDAGIGSFAIVDLSATGLSQLAEIVRPPQVCILAMASPKLSLSDDNSLQNLASVTLSFDGTIINEHVASKFLDTFKKFIENPNAYL